MAHEPPPVVPPITPPVTPPVILAVSLPPPVVLVVDADPVARVGYARDFERHGCTAILAESIAEAITCLSRPWLAIDVVWMGLDLPDGPGETILAIVKNTARLANVRTVAHWAADAGGDGGIDGRIVDLAGYGAGGFVDDPGDWAAVWRGCFPG